MAPARRKHDNGAQKYLRWWPVAVFLLAAAGGLAETRLQTQSNKENFTTHVKAAARVQQTINERLREQSELNGRIDERTKAIQQQLSTIIRELRSR